MSGPQTSRWTQIVQVMTPGAGSTPARRGRPR
jgi:hypothetical protein